MSKWISVNDALPNNGEYVLVLDRAPNPDEYLCRKAVPWVFQGRFYRHKGWEVLFQTDKLKIMHWMPLPEIPHE